jgi:OmcA/MtrC family decaheme c-type cytochrome
VVQLLDFRRMDFPGKINNCESCHVTFTGVSPGTGAVPALGSVQTYATVPSGSLVTVYESIDATYAAAYGTPAATPQMAKDSLRQANVTDTVRTPWAGACGSCHESSAARAHMAINGGAVDVTRTAAQPTPRPLEDVESCSVCHGPGRDFDTAVVHNK